MDLGLKDKVAIVTGGSRGLGEGLCLGLASEGVRVAVNYRQDRSRAERLLEQMRTRWGVVGTAVYADMTVEQDVVAMFDQVESSLGKVDILVNNAGMCPTSFVVDMPAKMFTDTITLNLVGTFLCSREMARRLLRDGRRGKIINIASQAAFKGSETGKSHYAASKAGIVAFTVSLARELADKGICVNAVAPGMIKTEMVAETLEKNAARYQSIIPLRRPAECEEIAHVVAFLASSKADYVTGATYDVSGGMLMR